MLTLIGVIDADMALDGNDIRAAERCFQLLYQLTGRAGREGVARRGDFSNKITQPARPASHRNGRSWTVCSYRVG